MPDTYRLHAIGEEGAATARLLQRIAEQVWAGTRRIGLAPTCCIAATRIAGKVCDYFGLPNAPLPVDALAWNAAADPLLDAGIPASQWPPEAWSVGSAGRDRRDGWGGHLTLAVTTPHGRFLVDPSLPQFTRPDRGIVATPFAGMVPGGWPEDAELFCLATDDPPAWITYRPSGNQRYRTSGDWRLWKERYPRVIGEVIRAVKAE